MLDLSGRGDEEVKQICSTALNQVPPDMVQLDDKMVKVLVSLLTATGTSVIGDGGNTVPEPPVHDLKPWSLRSASVAENPVDVQPSWINYVCQDFEVCSCNALPQRRHLHALSLRKCLSIDNNKIHIFTNITPQESVSSCLFHRFRHLPCMCARLFLFQPGEETNLMDC